MTLTDRIAALPKMPDYADYHQARGLLEYRTDRGIALEHRLTLLLDTVRAYTEAADAIAEWKGFHELSVMRLRGGDPEMLRVTYDKEMEYREDGSRIALADLRTLQKHLESEK